MGKTIGSKFNISPPDIGAGWSNRKMPRLGFVTLLATCATLAAFSSHAYADTASNGIQRVGARLATNSVSISTSGAVNIEVIPSSTGTLAVGKSTVTVTTDSSAGYQLYLSGLTADQDGLTAMNYAGRAGSTSKLTSIPANTPTAFTTTNQWGYAVGGGAFSTDSAYDAASQAGSITDRGTINGLTWQSVGKDMRLIRNTTETSPTTVYYGVYVDTNIMTGNYYNSVVYTAFVEGANKLEIFPMAIHDGETMTVTAEYLSADLPITSASQIDIALLDGETPVGTCDNIQIVSDGSAGLLEFTCTVHTANSFTAGELYDVSVNISFENREGGLSFHVDDVWGSGIVDGATMQNVAAGGLCKKDGEEKEYRLIDSRTNKYYTVRKMKDGNCWMVQNLWLAANTEYTAANGVTKFNTGNSVTTGWTTANAVNGMFYQGEHLDGTITASNNAENYDSTTNRGSFFNWKMATANTGGGYGTDKAATTSVCPQGWKLPTGGPTSTDHDFGKLYIATYSSQYSTFNAHWHGTGFGYCLFNTCSYNSTVGNWWSSIQSAAKPTEGAYPFALTASLYSFANSPDVNTGGKHAGFSVRCMLEGN